MNAADTLLAAAQVIRQRGLHKGDYVDPTRPDTGPVCVYGAIYVAAGGRFTIRRDPTRCQPKGNDGEAANAAIIAIRQFLGLTWLGEWNDTLDRTAEQVVAALETAATSVDGAS